MTTILIVMTVAWVVALAGTLRIMLERDELRREVGRLRRKDEDRGISTAAIIQSQSEMVKELLHREPIVRPIELVDAITEGIARIVAPVVNPDIIPEEVPVPVPFPLHEFDPMMDLEMPEEGLPLPEWERGPDIGGIDEVSG